MRIKVRKRDVDLLDQGDVALLGEEWVRVGADTFKIRAQGVVLNEFAEALGVPHGSIVAGTLWVQVEDLERALEEGVEVETWIRYEFDPFEVVEISPQLVRDLADALEEVLEEEEGSLEDMEDPNIAQSWWARAWGKLEEGCYWCALDKMLTAVTPGEVEHLAWELLDRWRTAK